MEQVLANTAEDRAAAVMNTGAPLVEVTTTQAAEEVIADVNPTVALLKDTKGQLSVPEYVLLLTLDLEGANFAGTDAASLKSASFDGKSLYNPFSKKPSAEVANGALAGFARAPLMRLIQSLSKLNKSPIYILSKPTERVALEKSMSVRILDMAAAEIGVPLSTPVVVGDTTLALSDFIRFSTWATTSQQEAGEESCTTTNFLNVGLSVPALIHSSNPAKFVKTINGIITMMLEKANAELAVFVNVAFKSNSFASAEVRSFVDHLIVEAGYDLTCRDELYANVGNSWVPSTKKAVDEMLSSNDMLMHCYTTHGSTQEDDAE